MLIQLKAATLKRFQSRLLEWFRAHRRDLPWRANRDPYRVWVAEIMLQQTRIAAVIPYYEQFLRRFPDVDRLARARQSEVLKLWSGLGYYSRARNLHSAAKQIVAQHNGEFPHELEAALALPGIGHYTAAAVLSIAFDAPLAVLDGNVARVLARLGAVRGDLRAPHTWRKLSETASRFLAREHAGDWNQALMELGETVCTPQSPRCAECPIRRWCGAHAQEMVDEIPAPRRKRAAVDVKIAAAILRDPQGRTLLVKDPGAHDGVLFSRMWQFPAVEVKRHAKAELAKHLCATLGVNGVSLEALPAARHGVTFRNVTLLPFLARVAQLPAGAGSRGRFLPLSQIAQLPISSATRKIAAALEHP
ncbi:MAG: A/G-specific adenine glycosylase [Candidatus Acidiferrales bacterium]